MLPQVALRLASLTHSLAFGHPKIQKIKDVSCPSKIDELNLTDNYDSQTAIYPEQNWLGRHVCRTKLPPIKF